jgi:hypothetical protein
MLAQFTEYGFDRIRIAHTEGFKEDIPAAVGPTKAPNAKEEVKMLETSE